MTKFDRPKDAVQYPVNTLISGRWSPRSFDDQDIQNSTLMSLFEAVRWAASSMNAQPWEFIYAHKGSEAHGKIAQTLMDGNVSWAEEAPVLMIAMIRKYLGNGKPNGSARHDLGLAMGNLSLQAEELGIGLHQMGGFYPQKARELFNLPEDVEPVTAVALGYYGDPEQLSEPLKSREIAKRSRKEVTAFAFQDSYQAT